MANAALPASGLLDSFSVDELDRALDVNLRAPIVLARLLGPRLAERGSGHIVFISSLAGKAAAPRSSLYSATKFGLRGFSLGLRADMHKHGVGVSTVFPGFIRDAGMFAESGAKLPRASGRAPPRRLLRRVQRAIERNKAEVVIAPAGMRLVSAFAGVAPSFAERATRRLGRRQDRGGDGEGAGGQAVTPEAPPVAAPEAPPPPPSQQPSRRSRHAMELLATVALALTLAFAVEALAVKPYRIPSPSMEPTLRPGQRVLVNRLEKRLGGYGVGDIVVFKPPAGADQSVSSCGVDRPRARRARSRSTASRRRPSSSASWRGRATASAFDGGHVIRNGRRASEPFIRACDGAQDCTLPRQITIPRGRYFVMGDNRGDSFDSRFWGAIPKGWIIGQAFATYWPPGRLGTL